MNIAADVISVNSSWSSKDNPARIVIVREIISEDGILWIKFGAHAHDTVFGTPYENFLIKFIRMA